MLKGISPVVSPDLLKTLAEIAQYGNIILKKGVTPVSL